MAILTHWDDQQPLKAVYEFSRLRDGSLSKSASDDLEKRIAGTLYEGISTRISAAIEATGKTEAEIARHVPRQDGTGSITDRHLRTLIANPYKMTVQQVMGLCGACGCDISYLRGDYRDAMPGFLPDQDEYKTIVHVGKALKAYQVLTDCKIEERLYSSLSTVVAALHKLGVVPEGFDEEGWYDGSIVNDYRMGHPSGLEVSGNLDGRTLESLVWAIDDLHGCFEAIESIVI